MERLSHHAAAAHFNMCNGAEIGNVNSKCEKNIKKYN